MKRFVLCGAAVMVVCLAACQPREKTNMPSESSAPTGGSTADESPSLPADAATQADGGLDADRLNADRIAEDRLAEDDAVTESEPTSPGPSDQADDGPGLAVGEAAPGFLLPDQNGEPRSLEQLLQAGNVALVFYRSADW